MRDKSYLTSSEVAERLGVDTRTVARWVRQGRLAASKTLGGHARFDPDQIDQLAQELTVPVADDAA